MIELNRKNGDSQNEESQFKHHSGWSFLIIQLSFKKFRNVLFLRTHKTINELF
jgi:hypothetical protein